MIARVQRFDDSTTHSFELRSGDIIYWGFCRSGKRYLWVVENHSTHMGEYGYVPIVEHRSIISITSRDEAELKARESIERITTLPLPQVFAKQSVAQNHLRRLNAEKRRQRPPKTGTQESSTTQYLYAVILESDRDRVHAIRAKYRVVKITRKSIFYDKQNLLHNGYARHYDDIRCGYVRKIDLDQRHYWRSRVWTMRDPATYGQRRTANTKQDLENLLKEIKGLKEARKKAHPDKGGTAEAFVKANDAYEAAMRRVDELRAAVAEAA